jgi:hypothetical protein
VPGTEILQLDLFGDQAQTEPSSNPVSLAQLAPEGLSDAALIGALPNAVQAGARALALEAGRRRLDGAVAALTALCQSFVGFGADRMVPEQAAALDALVAIGGSDACRSVCEIIVEEIVQGPTLVVALSAASQLGVKFPAAVGLRLLGHFDPSVRAAACACVRAGPETVAALVGLLVDRDREVLIAAACALGRMGRGEARGPLKSHLSETPSPRVIEALAGVADEEAVVLLARLGRGRPDLAPHVLAALDEIDDFGAIRAASALRRLAQRS